MFSRILSNTKKQIIRSGWAGWASISVMTLAFLVACIFGGLAYFSNLWIQFIESKSNMLVFFEVGIDQEIPKRLQDKWELNPKIKNITYFTEEEAYQLFADYSEIAAPVINNALETNPQISGKLQSSLDIEIYSLDDLKDLEQMLQSDIEAELKQLEIVDTTEGDGEPAMKYKYQLDESMPPVLLKVDSQNLNQLREVFLSVRVAGIFVISLLFVVIFFFTFMTVEFRLYNQMEEIGVMQLVGGSLYFIRMPYILEGGFYGFIGSLLSSAFLGVILIFTFYVNTTSAITVYFYKNFFQLPWPYISPLGWGLVIFLLAIGGFLLGAISSYISIRRYIR